MLYILNNPNFSHLGFTKEQILKLWGELFYWSLIVINLKPSYNVKGITKYEAYHKIKPDLRTIRLLPIGSILYVLKRNNLNKLNSKRVYWQKGIYIGPSRKVLGAIRVACLTNKKIQIVVSSIFKTVTDGGDLNIYPIVNRHLDPFNEIATLTPPTLTTPAATIVPVVSIPSFEDPKIIESDLEETTNVENNEDEDSTLANTNNSISKVRGDRSVKGNIRKVKFRNDNISDEDSKYKPKEISKLEREERILNRNKLKEWQDSSKSAEELLSENSYFVDWSTHTEESYYLSFTENWFIIIDSDNESDKNEEYLLEESSFRAVKENVPKNFTAALKDPIWGEAARTEFNKIMVDTRAVVEVDRDTAVENIKKGAEVLRMLAVYEIKIKEGKEVKQVRLVADGRQHNLHGATYAPTPSREELLMLMHIMAVHDMDYFHVDEIRAFLNAMKQDNDKFTTYVKFGGDSKYYQILNALYGLKTAPRDYQDATVTKLVGNLGFKRLHLCSCIYVRRK
jgi:hypothetical protein